MIASTPLLFFAGAAICFTAAAPHYNSNELELKVHIYSAMGGVILGLLSLIIDFGLWYLVLGAGIVGILSLVRINKNSVNFKEKFYLVKNNVWGAEIIAYVTIVVGLGFVFIVNKM